LSVRVQVNGTKIWLYRDRFAGKRKNTSFDALPERRVTVHSGDMGYTIGPFAGRAKCPGRSVTRWMNG